MMRYLLVLFVLALLLPIVAAAQEPESFYAIAPAARLDSSRSSTAIQARSRRDLIA